MNILLYLTVSDSGLCFCSSVWYYLIMKISKYLHSCLLVEDEGRAILIDPGNYTFKERALDLDKISKLDYLLVTHEHQDHMYMPLIKQILEKFPKIKIISNNSVKKILEGEGLKLQTEGENNIAIENAPHEILFGGRGAENFLFNISGKLTHPGDSLQFSESHYVLALPVQAPWGSFVASVEKAIALKPKIVIPIHDWHWKDTARRRMYETAKQYLAGKGIEFHGLETGEMLEI